MVRFNIRRGLVRLGFRLARAAESGGIRQLKAYHLAARLYKAAVFGRRTESFSHHIDSCTFEIPYSLLNDYVLKDFEPQTLAFLTHRLVEGSVLVDAGANIGVVSCIAARLVGNSGRVFAIEPARSNLEFLRLNLRRNGIENVTVLECAIGDRDETAQLSTGGTGTVYTLFGPRDQTRTEEVPVRRLDSIVSTRIDVLKIDIEGAEFRALLGFGSLVTNQMIDCMIVEWNPTALARSGSDPSALPDLLRQLGFGRLGLLDAGGVTLQQAERLLAENRLPAKWYCNIVAERSEHRS